VAEQKKRIRNYFNSTMVRLTVQAALLVIIKAFGHFNSTMVRLTVKSGFLMAATTMVFQFHYGSIDRWNGFLLMYPFLTNFNSTMVRLTGNG